jgi:hypothetical protein
MDPPSPSEAAIGQREPSIHQSQRSYQFNLILGGYAFFEVLYSATKLGLFTHLDTNPGGDREQIGRALGLAAHPLRVLLLACVSLHLLRKEGERYFNAPGLPALVLDQPNCIMPVLEAYHSIIFRPTFRLHDSLKAGTNVGLAEIPGDAPSLYQKLEEIPRLEAVFHDWMACIGRLAGLNEGSIALIDPILSNVGHLVDYGGGDGSNAIKLCRVYPHLRVTIFDLPKVCAMARRNIEQNGHGLLDRITLREGDFLKNPMLPDADAILFSHIFNIYSAKTNQTLVEKSYVALRSGGALIVFNSVSSDNEDGPLGSALLSLYFLALATGEGMVYPLKDYDAWFQAAGFKEVTKLRLPASADRAFVIGVK